MQVMRLKEYAKLKVQKVEVRFCQLW